MFNNEKQETLDLSLFSVCLLFNDGDKLVPFVPLFKTYDHMVQEWFWVGFRLDKSNNLRDFLIDMGRSIDKKDLKLYRNHVFNDILVKVPVDDAAKGDWLAHMT